jgi:hypothetical protein
MRYGRKSKVTRLVFLASKPYPTMFYAVGILIALGVSRSLERLLQLQNVHG